MEINDPILWKHSITPFEYPRIR